MEYASTHKDVQESNPDDMLLGVLVKLLGQQRFDLWFGKNAQCRSEEAKIIFSVRNHFAINSIRANCQREIDQAALQVFGQIRPVDFVVKPAAKPVPKPVVTPSVPKPLSPLQSVGTLFKKTEQRTEQKLGRRFATLETFLEGLSNRLACRAADLAVYHPSQINPIYLCGPASVGKTHLLEGIWSAVRKNTQRKPPLYLTSEQFISSFLESIRPGNSVQGYGVQSFRNRFKGISMFLLDDVQYFSRKDATQTELLNIIDMLRNQGVQIVIAGDRPLKELTGFRDELICRLEAGMVCGIELPERELSLRIFQEMISQRKLPIGPDVCRMVTSRLGNHARQLSGALNRLHAVYLTSGEPISLQVAEEALGDLIRTNRRDIRLPDIEKIVCETFGLSDDSLQSKSRVKQIATPRMLAMWLARKYTRSALSEIGRYFGNHSHSSVVSAQKKIDKWIGQDETIAGALRKMEQKLG
jgi:chromosomal replication initiator protein